MLNNINSVIAIQLAKLTAAKKIKDADVIRRCGFTRPTLMKIKNGENVTVETIGTLAEGLGVPYAYFFDENETKTSASIKTEGDFSPASQSGNISQVIGDSALSDRVKYLEAIISEKDRSIKAFETIISEKERFIEMLTTTLKE